MPIRLALMEDVLAAGQSLAMPARPRPVFARRGPLRVTEAGGEVVLETGQCRLFEAAISLHGPGEAWTFELSASGNELVVAEAERPRVILATLIDRDPNEQVIVRADRVDFPPRAVTPKHGHKGPGIRRLIEGRLLAEIGDHVHRIDAGDAWFETGVDPVVGRNLAPTSVFVRVMVLDPALLGEPTFIPWTPEEVAKPRGTDRMLFFDTAVTIPPG
jgi:quercetin dioxygenase-like cupin family protein